MRSIRRLGIAAALLAAPLGLQAQKGADDAVFQNAWYWGASYGQISFPTTIAKTTAPEIGGEWLITRQRWGAQFYAAQSYFNAQSTIQDVSTTAQRRVDLQDMRRVGFQALLFGPKLRWVRPYAGAGFSFNFIKEATLPANASFASAAARDSVLQRIDGAKSQARLSGTAGFLVQYKRFAPFAQVTVIPMRGSGDWLINGTGFTNQWQVGLRYTFTGAIERY